MSEPVVFRRYYLPSQRALGGWAEIVLGSNGFFAAVSDYGNYAHAWRNTGESDVRRFILRLCVPDEWEYVAGKLGTKTRYDGTATLRGIRSLILEYRRDGSWPKERAQKEWELLQRLDLEGSEHDFSLWYYETLFDCAYEYKVLTYSAPLEAFCRRTMPRLGEMISRELADEERKAG